MTINEYSFINGGGPWPRRPTLRKVTFGGANSLDNYLARKDHAVDWLLWSREAAAVTADYWTTIDTILMGRKTYQVALRTSSASKRSSKRAKNEAPYAGMKTYVFSATLDPRSHPGVTIVTSGAGAFVRRLKSEKGKGICLMGGGELARSLFNEGLIDEIGLNIHPVLLGSGIPLFHPLGRQLNLALLESKTFPNGCVYVRYRVKNFGPRFPGEGSLGDQSSRHAPRKDLHDEHYR